MLNILRKTILIIISLTAVLLLTLNILNFIESTKPKNQKTQSLIIPGVQFVNFEKKLKDQRFAGYLTDKKMTPDGETMSFLQAQYLLAPTILIEGDTTQKFIILDFRNFDILKNTIISLGPRKLHRTQFNKILAERLTP